MTIPLRSFPQLLRDHLKENPSTPSIEGLGRKLAGLDFPHERTAEFVREVCTWGGYAGIAGRVLKDNAIEAICDAFRKAAANLTRGAVFRALNDVNAISGLGTPSFASKHLRFLRPDICAVFDSILRDSLGVPFNAAGYTEFCGDCAVLARLLTEHALPCAARREGGVASSRCGGGSVYLRSRRATSTLPVNSGNVPGGEAGP